MEVYKQTLDITYSQIDGITTLVEAAGQRFLMWFLVFVFNNLKNTHDFFFLPASWKLQLPSETHNNSICHAGLAAPKAPSSGKTLIYNTGSPHRYKRRGPSHEADMKSE